VNDLFEFNSGVIQFSPARSIHIS